jgi:hypothetical protein
MPVVKFQTATGSFKMTATNIIMQIKSVKMLEVQTVMVPWKNEGKLKTKGNLSVKLKQ